MKSDSDIDFSRARQVVPSGTHDPEFEDWLKVRRAYCFYGKAQKWGPCKGQLVFDHILGGFHGVKASGLFGVMACWHHNQLAEVEQEMHREAFEEEKWNYLVFASEKLKERDYGQE